MKTLVKTLSAVLFLVLVSGASMAQTEVVNDNCDGTGVPLNLENGSGAQMKGQMAGNGAGVMSQLKENGGDFRDAFKATLTEEQLAVIANLELTRDEKREALQATFSEVQQELYNSHMSEVAERQAARGSSALSKGQAANAAKNGMRKGQK